MEIVPSRKYRHLSEVHYFRTKTMPELGEVNQVVDLLTHITLPLDLYMINKELIDRVARDRSLNSVRARFKAVAAINNRMIMGVMVDEMLKSQLCCSKRKIIGGR